jgi:hypothetical protein
MKSSCGKTSTQMSMVSDQAIRCNKSPAAIINPQPGKYQPVSNCSLLIPHGSFLIVHYSLFIAVRQARNQYQPISKYQ